MSYLCRTIIYFWRGYKRLQCVCLCCRWLQPDSYADPQKTSLILNKDDIRCGWPTVITVQTKDQYGDVVHVPNMKVIIEILVVHKLHYNFV